MTATRLCPTMTEHNALDSKKLIVHSLYGGNITTSNVEYTVMLDRKFSDYDLLVIAIGYGSSTRNTLTVYKNLFLSGEEVIITSLHGGTSGNARDYSISGTTVKYISDTKFKAQAWGSGTLYKLWIIGIGFDA